MKVITFGLSSGFRNRNLISDKSSGQKLASLATPAVKRLDVDEDKASFLAALFDARFYSATAGLAMRDPDRLFEHYLTHGMPADLSPSPLFDPTHVRQSLGLNNNAIDKKQGIAGISAMQAWLLDGYNHLPAVKWFDDAFYRSFYPDMESMNGSCYQHFVVQGLSENRLPNAYVRTLCDSILTHFPSQPFRFARLMDAAPRQSMTPFLRGDYDAELAQLFMSEFYRGSIKAGHDVPDAALLAHFLAIGWQSGKRPSFLFHEEWYRQLVENRSELPAIGAGSAYLHWYCIGRAAGLIPTPIFDPAHYLEVHKDIRKAMPDAPFEHYLTNGVREPGRSPSVYFEPVNYQNLAGKRERSVPIIDYFVRGQHLDIPPVAGIDLQAFDTSDRWKSSVVEELAILSARKLQRLGSGVLAEQFERTQQLEPQIVRPYGRLNVRVPPRFHPEATITAEAQRVYDALPGKQYESVVLIPHCRMAGSAKVSGSLVDALSRVTDPSRVLLITTDTSVFERAEWFPSEVAIFDLAEHLTNTPMERRCRILLDLVRGLTPKRLININSNLGWQTTTRFGRQLAEWMHLYVYLFCWDLSEKGHKGGYPIQWMLPTFDYCSAVFTDDTSLREELISRYAPSSTLARRFVTLFEPAREVDVDYKAALTARAAHSGKRRVFWCGRFDRQKRTDLLVDIAAAMPDIEFLVWGKAVMKDGPDYLSSAPDNLKLMGAYAHIDDVPIASCDCYLYTSSWDGMPSVLIEMATRNVPIVASKVGGVGELIAPGTGWLVDDVDNVDAYVRALREAIEKPEEALGRATRLRERTIELCSVERYDAAIADTIGRESTHDARAHSLTTTPNMPQAVAPAADTGINITAVLTAHAEGALAAVAYRSFEDACKVAEQSGLSVERVVMLDNANTATELVFEDLNANVSIIRTDYADQGAVRNHAASAAKGRYIAFLDGDDLWSSNWLLLAHKFLVNAPPRTIAHPEVCWFFSGTLGAFFNIDQDDPNFRKDFLRHGNYWDAMSMAEREAHLAHPYCARRIADGFAFEDWHWNCETIEDGYRHKVVHNTLHFKRRRNRSQTIEASTNHSLMPYSKLTSFSV